MDNYNKIVALTYGGQILNVQPLNENTMIQEYEHVRNLRPEFKIAKDGLIIKGLTA